MRKMSSENERIKDEVCFSGMETVTQDVLHQRVKVSGLCKIPHSLECDGLKVSGSVEAGENLLVNGEFHNSGLFRCHGNLLVKESAKCSGSATIDGEFKVGKDFHASGHVACHDSLEILGDFKSSGAFTVYKNLTVQGLLESSGMFTIDGDLQAYDIKIRSWKGINIGPLSFGNSRVDGNLTAMNAVELKNIHIKGDIYADHITISKDCQINGIIYVVNDLIVQDKRAPPYNVIKITKEELMAHLGQKGYDVPNYCAQCGQKLSADAKFCPSCGLNITRDK